jgi:C4-dicarboxylate-specific signal transduction histidine kinase
LITRANELNEQKHAITLLYEQIQATYDQLIKAEKMATLGQLTSGIVQVIGTPIKSSEIYLKNLQHDLNQILEILHQYTLINQGNYQEILKNIDQQKQEIDFHRVISNLYALPKTMAGNINEAIELIRELKVFSSLNQAEMVPYDLIAGLNASLNLIVRQHQKIIKVHKDLGRIAHIECYPGRINQVFMNLLSFSAKQLKKQQKENQLFVSARMIKEKDDNLVEIKIAFACDQQKCRTIEAAMQTFFNDPLQDVEQVGISIATNVVNEHQGKLELYWLEEKCTFCIKLPVKPVAT